DVAYWGFNNQTQTFSENSDSNASLVAWWKFNNNSAVGENDTNIVDGAWGNYNITNLTTSVRYTTAGKFGAGYQFPIGTSDMI
ncbi:hypothetical protein ACS2UQ_27065, partial [Bacillus cereus group sp. BC305]|uniref:hypothetical protein n=1 Tax=Bacillus cereus group sp. BC305 TaxID=3445321 RepID=UPI003F22FF18